jgi:CheY-like chemotaxis protein
MTTSLQALTVLIVDDEPDMRDLARVVLESDGINVVDEAVDGVQALERYFELDPPPIPSAVLLDHRMPGLTGLQVAEKILAHNPDQVIVLFSAYLDTEVVDAATAAGVTACVSKMDVTRLAPIIRGLLPAHG